MSSKPLAAWKPEWKVELDDVNQLTGSLNSDSLLNTHPIHQDAQTPAQILELADGITYGKTAAVLRMLEFYLGPETFQAGVNAYLKKHAYGNATAADFWGAQTEVSHKPVDKLMPTFVQQPGPPFVNVKTQCSGKQETVSVSQQRYFYDRTRMNQGGNELWQIPLCVKGGFSEKGAEHCELLTQTESSFTLPGCSPWLYANAGGKGYYRSGYSPEAVSEMARAAETAFTPEERIMLLSDVWASVRVGRAPIGTYLSVAEGLHADGTSAVQDQLFGQLDYIGRYLVSDADRPAYELWLRQMLAPMAKEVGWEPKPGEPAEQAVVRVRLLHALGSIARDPEVAALARKWADQALDDPSSVNDEIAFESLQIAALNGDAAFYDKVLAHMKAAKNPEEYYGCQQALASFTDPKLLQRTLDFALSPDSRSQDSLLLIGRVMRNPAGQALTWDFVRSHWSSLEKASSAFGGGGGAVVASTGSFCDAHLRDEVSDFFTAHNVPATARTLKQALERINYCVDLKDQQGTQLASWLQHQGGATGK
jgi:aminopeptidase N/puromycin-sensitive aminopeptidase